MKFLLLALLFFSLAGFVSAQGLTDCQHPCERTRTVSYGPFIGVKIADIPAGNHVLVMEVLPRTAAEAFGIRSGDILTHLNEVELNNTAHLLREVAQRQPGDEVRLLLERGGRRMDYAFPLGAQFSKTITETVCCDSTDEPGLTDLALSVDAAQEKLTLQSAAEAKGDVRADIVNEQGVLLKSQHAKGTGRPFSMQLDIHDLPQGSYMLSVLVGRQRYVKRFAKGAGPGY